VSGESATTAELLGRLAADVDPQVALLVLRCAAEVPPDALARLVARRAAAGAPCDVRSVLDALTRDTPRPRHGAVDAAVDALMACGARMLVVGGPGYPRRLADLWPDRGAPAWLFVRGALPDRVAAAVVGTRRASLDGRTTSTALGRLLAAGGVRVVSGLARGIDQAAHMGALHEPGGTVAVLGCGFGVDYPRGDATLREAVAAAGALVTEHLPGVPPAPHRFLARNRIISGLADAVVVVEGRARSGALHTARLGAEQGRDVWAVPGSLNSPTSRGPLDLVADGARLVTRYTDVLDDLAPGLLGRRAPEPAARPGGLAGLLGAEPATSSALAAALGRPVSAILAELAALEARGAVRMTPRGYVAVAAQDDRLPAPTTALL